MSFGALPEQLGGIVPVGGREALSAAPCGESLHLLDSSLLNGAAMAPPPIADSARCCLPLVPGTALPNELAFSINIGRGEALPAAFLRQFLYVFDGKFLHEIDSTLTL